MGIAAIVILVTGIGIHTYANASKTKIFTGINGEAITVHSDRFSVTDTDENSTGNEDIKTGDIIDGSDGEEIVIGVSDDGQFITMPLADYQSER